MAAEKSPKTVTVYGRLSFPNFTYAQAVKRNATSQYKKADESEVKPDFNLLLEDHQLDKFIVHIRDEFLPYCLKQHEAGEKRDALDKKQVDTLLKQLEAGDWDTQPPYIPIKVINEKTAKLAPECVANLKIVGNQGADIEQKAIVNSEDELAVPDGDIIVTDRMILPIGQTVHQMYGGCYVAATVNLYAFVSGKLPGYSASASVAVFKADGERFGGGVSVDEDEIFAD